MIYLDTETALIAPGRQHPPLACLTVAHNDGAPRLFHVSEAYPVARAILECSEPIAAHNAAFDMAVLVAQWPDLRDLVLAAYENDRIHCTEVRAKLQDIAAGCYRRFYVHKTPDGASVNVKIKYKLSLLVKRFFGHAMTGKATDDDADAEDDPIQLKYGELIDKPLSWWPKPAIDYALDDVVWMRNLHATQPDNPDQGRQARAAFLCAIMQANGVTLSRERVEAFARQIFGEYEELTTQLKQWGWVRPNGSRDTKQVMHYIDMCNPPNHPRTSKGPSLDAEFLNDTGNPHLKVYAKASQLRIVISKDLKFLAEGVRNGVINSRIDSLKETGRTSSSGPNLQNLATDPGVRECIVPREGYTFVVVDYSGFELSTWAQVCWSMLGRSRMREALNDGMDPHCQVASEIMHCSYDEAVRTKAKGQPGYYPRQCGKVVNFGRQGGLGAKRLVVYAKSSYGVTLTLPESQALIKFWGQTWTEGQPYFDRISELLDRGYLEQLWVGRVRGGCSFTEGCNTMFQGLAADAAKAVGWELLRATYNPRSVLYGSRIVLFVHDEFVLEVPIDRVHECAEEQERIMIAAAKPFIPDVVVKCETHATMNYSKKGERIIKQGKLVPWTLSTSC